MGSKSLGVLTLDIVAKIGGFVDGMSKAERESRKRMDGIAKSVGKATAALGGLSIAAAAGAVVKNVADSAKEIENLSKVANSGVEEFQRITFAAKQYGVEQDKVADILKDTSDKVGDFLQTGGGALADYFENIAPSIGQTAEQFRNLSGRDALQLYVDGLEKANLSQSEMTFYMEAIASDATLLLPLLKNNGRELGRLSKQADDLGAVLSDLDIQQLNEVARQTDVLKGAFQGAANQATVALLPAIKDLSSLLQDQNTIDAMSRLVSGFAGIAKNAAEALVNVTKFSKFVGEELARTLNGAASDDIAGLERQLDQIKDLKNSGPLDRLRFFGKDGLVEYYDDAELDAEISKITAQLKQAYAGATVNPTGDKQNDSGTTATVAAAEVVRLTATQREEQKKLNEEFDKMLLAYQQQIAFAGEATELEKIRFEVTQGSLKGITDEQLRQLEANAALVDGYNELIAAAEAAGEAEEKRAELKAQFMDLQDSLKSEAELENARYAQSLELLKQAEDAKIESIKPYQELREQLEQEHQDRLSAISSDAEAERLRFAKMSGFEQAKFLSGFYANMTSVAAQGSRKMFEVNKVAALASATINGLEAISSSYAFGSEIGGPYVGAAMAAIAAAAQWGTLQQINSQSFGGGSVSPSVAGTGASAVVATTQTAQQITPQNHVPSVVVNISGPVTGLNEDILAERINELIERDYINLRSA